MQTFCILGLMHSGEEPAHVLHAEAEVARQQLTTEQVDRINDVLQASLKFIGLAQLPKSKL